MAKRTQEEQWRRADEKVRKKVPPGVKLVRTLRGYTDWIGRIAWSPDGRMLASPSADKTIRSRRCQSAPFSRNPARIDVRRYTTENSPVGAGRTWQQTEP